MPEFLAEVTEVRSGFNRDLRARIITALYPTHLGCPYCPAQALPAMVRGRVADKSVRAYVCPSKHQFYIHPEEETDTDPRLTSRFDDPKEEETHVIR